MEYDIQNSLDILYQLLVIFYHSSFMMWVKIFMGIYLSVILIDIVLLLLLRDVGWHLRVGLKGMDLPLASKGKLRKRWDKVKSRLKNESPSQYKVAIIEADAIAEEILDGIGYKGANMTEKLEQVGPNHLDEHLETLKEAHQVRNRIVHEADFVVDHRMATAVVGVYESFLKYLEFLD
ncbi:MAG: hypothetical protein UR99_C0071G0006 [Candidatus Moranbacteria bacterium GW2011_GWD2_36_12]|nr:MAG: hypothetical protein UR99_C0071G0006 [Candidatus Moranbacteria bacterium GW2011_GWD2_36_12]KKQ04517.1 MAG: hypothetical protein US16_C0056G0005 [Candidatus Moranbacteria bacterium GW2011_GWE2_36_40]